jgi:hypothetical protein
MSLCVAANPRNFLLAVQVSSNLSVYGRVMIPIRLALIALLCPAAATAQTDTIRSAGAGCDLPAETADLPDGGELSEAGKRGTDGIWYEKEIPLGPGERVVAPVLIEPESGTISTGEGCEAGSRAELNPAPMRPARAD